MPVHDLIRPSLRFSITITPDRGFLRGIFLHNFFGDGERFLGDIAAFSKTAIISSCFFDGVKFSPLVAELSLRKGMYHSLSRQDIALRNGFDIDIGAGQQQ